jgi:lactoylglutathione lyase
MSRIHHIALFCTDLESTRAFYEAYFGATCGPRYENLTKGFASYFLALEGDVRIEIMQKVGVESRSSVAALGYAHVAISVGSRQAVDDLTERIKAAGYAVLSLPRVTGDGYYESVVADPDGNAIEITV